MVPRPIAGKVWSVDLPQSPMNVRNVRSRTLRTPPALAARALTIVEVLVAMGVILLLAGLLVPSVQNARRLGRQSVCLRQLGSHLGVMAAYAADHDDHWPYPFRERQGDAFTFADGRPAPSIFSFESAAALWHIPILEAYGGRAFHESLVCPEDKLTKVIVKAAADRAGVTPEDIRGTLGYQLSQAMLLDPRALDPAHPSDDPSLRAVQTHTAVQTPSAKAALVELLPRHDAKYPGGLSVTWTQYVYVRTAAGADGSARAILSDRLTPGVTAETDPVRRSIAAEAGKMIRTPRGVRGQDW